MNNKPMILAPAGGKASFFAALAADADGIYCGLKEFSARMKADNFTVEELAPLAELAHDKGKKIFIAMNSLLKEDEADYAGKLIKALEKHVKPDALIIQDTGFIKLARDAGFSKQIHLSTLACVTFGAGLKTAKDLGVKTVVLPRELNIDEIKMMTAAAPSAIDLEIFVHGALCYGVSGRCYWSSFLGGKSGLRGMCVQPCRRFYNYEDKKERFFSCKDLCLDFLVKVLLPLKNIRAWKIEGRKKGPHYVFYTVKGYKLLRDYGDDSLARKEAFNLLMRALGRERTHYNFLPQRQFNPTALEGDTASGLFIGKIKKQNGKFFFNTEEALIRSDLLRIGYEDQKGHRVLKIKRYIPRRGRFYINVESRFENINGFSVFLIDRMEKELEDKIEKLKSEIKEPDVKIAEPYFKSQTPSYIYKSQTPVKNLYIYADIPNNSALDTAANLTYKNITGISDKKASFIYWNLPCVIWPQDEADIKKNIGYLLKKGCFNFIINSLWQLSLFEYPKKLNIIAGAFCNIANTPAIIYAQNSGVKKVVLSPELSKDDYLNMPSKSPLPLGIITNGLFPLSISRIIPDDIKENTLFTSPKGEGGFIKKSGSNYNVYPNWVIDLNDKKKELEKAGYSFFVDIKERIPKTIDMKKRENLWNWNTGLK